MMGSFRLLLRMLLLLGLLLLALLPQVLLLLCIRLSRRQGNMVCVRVGRSDTSSTTRRGMF